MDALGKARPAIARAAVFGLVAAIVSSVGQTYFIGLFGSFLRHEHALTEAGLGALYGAATLVSGGLMFWLGSSADRMPLTRIVPAVVATLAAGCFAMGTTTGVVVLGLAFILLRFGGQGMMSHLAIVTAARSSTERRGRNVAIAASGFMIGGALLPATITATLGYLPWRAIWLSAGVVLLVVALPALWLLASKLPDSAADKPRAQQEPAPQLGRMALIGTPQFLAALGVVLVAPFVVTAVFFHLTALGELRGWSARAIASGFAVFAAMQFSATFITGRLVDRFGANRVLRFHLLPMGMAMLVLGTLDLSWGMWIVFAGLGATAGADAVVAGALWAELFGTEQIGMVRSIYATFAVLSTALAPFLLGQALSDATFFTIATAAGAAYCALVPSLLARHARRPKLSEPVP